MDATLCVVFLDALSIVPSSLSSINCVNVETGSIAASEKVKRFDGDLTHFRYCVRPHKKGRCLPL